jgi:hypothetical protein
MPIMVGWTDWKRSMRSRASLVLGLVVAGTFSLFLPTLWADGTEHRLGLERTWTFADGRVIRARLESASGSQVRLRLADGRASVLWLQHLSSADQEFVKNLAAGAPADSGVPVEKRIWPQIVEVDSRSIEVEELPPVTSSFLYRTKSFEFDSQEKLSKSVMREIARTFEATRALVESLPWSIRPSPPGDSEYFKAKLFASHDAYVEAGAPKMSGGVYSRKDGILRVPFESLGLQLRGKTWFMERAYSNDVIIHELTHQLMSDMLPFLPTWAVEGTAEYVEALPYNAGRFQPGLDRRGLKEFIDQSNQRGISPSDTGSLYDVLTMPREKWLKLSYGGEPDDQYKLYLASYLLVYYFCHLDDDGRGLNFMRYLDAARADATEWQTFLANPRVKKTDDGYFSPQDLPPPKNSQNETAALSRIDSLLTRGRDAATMQKEIIAAYRKIGVSW